MISAPTQGPKGRCAYPPLYPLEHADAIDRPKNSWDFRAQVLATIVTCGPLELSAIRGKAGLGHALATDLLESIRCLIRTGCLLAIPQTEWVVTTDGMRTRRDFTLYCLGRPGGGDG
jgi:hypothetical protein